MITWLWRYIYAASIWPDTEHRCKACWRSHRCWRFTGHRGKHRCECGEAPKKYDMFHDHQTVRRLKKGL